MARSLRRKANYPASTVSSITVGLTRPSGAYVKAASPSSLQSVLELRDQRPEQVVENVLGMVSSVAWR